MVDYDIDVDYLLIGGVENLMIKVVDFTGKQPLEVPNVKVKEIMPSVDSKNYYWNYIVLIKEKQKIDVSWVMN